MGGQFVTRHQRPDQVDEHRRQLRWRDGIKQVVNLRRGRDLVDPEQRGGVVATALFLHPYLEIKKRGALHEEHREGTQAGIPHRVAPVVAAFAGIRQIAQRLADRRHRLRHGEGRFERRRGLGLEDDRSLR